MPQPGMFNPRGEDWIAREITDLKRSMRELAAANPFGPMGIKPKAGGMVVEGYQTVNGPMTITGSLDLPAGSVQNDALASPVQIDTASNGIDGEAITTTSTVRASVTLTVPTGMTQAIVMATATGMGENSTTASDYLYVSAVVEGVNGGELYTAAPAGLGASLAAPFNTTLTGLTDGQEITVGVATRTGTAEWAASTANQASISATVMYLR
ncbi:hypothetical protein [Pseudarthrobacter sp. LMD1-1-1.1]|uniref:hypothetical protein n=1 Tax=Pseudarthrobacter sp. LMD1-1-1.1 TaxID=3135242 RepID=UPI0034133097